MTDLWCVHIEGPDDMIAMPSREAAEAEAKLLNESWRKDGHEYDPVLNAVAKPWPYSAEQHAKDIARSVKLEGGLQ